MSEETKLNATESLLKNLEEKKVETEVKTEETKKETKTEELILGKFKTQEDLITSYKELESKLGTKKDISKLSDEELIEYNKEVFKGLNDTETLLQGDLKGIAEGLNTLGMPTKFVDVTVAETAKKVLELEREKNKQRNNTFLSISEEKAAVERFVHGQDSHFKTDFNDRLKAGTATLAELHLYAKQGKKEIEESSVSLDLGVDPARAGGSEEEMHNELMKIIETKGHIWNNVKHPQYSTTMTRMETLKKALKY